MYLILGILSKIELITYFVGKHHQINSLKRVDTSGWRKVLKQILLVINRDSTKQTAEKCFMVRAQERVYEVAILNEILLKRDRIHVFLNE